MDEDELERKRKQDEKEQAEIASKTVKEASDTKALHKVLDRLNEYKRTPEQEQELKEKLDRLHEKIKRIKAQQSKESKL